MASLLSTIAYCACLSRLQTSAFSFQPFRFPTSTTFSSCSRNPYVQECGSVNPGRHFFVAVNPISPMFARRVGRRISRRDGMLLVQFWRSVRAGVGFTLVELLVVIAIIAIL